MVGRRADRETAPAAKVEDLEKGAPADTLVAGERLVRAAAAAKVGWLVAAEEAAPEVPTAVMGG
jgi:hypothetical protein